MYQTVKQRAVAGTRSEDISTFFLSTLFCVVYYYVNVNPNGHNGPLYLFDIKLTANRDVL